MTKTAWLLLLSFFISSIFWLATVSSQQNIKIFEEPIAVKFFNVPEGLHVTSAPINISIKIDTSKDKTKKIFAENFQSFIDFTNAKIGENNFQIQVKTQDQSIRIVSYSPKELTLNLEKVQEKMLEPTLEMTGNVSKNYTVKTAEIVEKQVTVTAGESDLDNIIRVKAVLELKGESNSIEKTLEFKAYNSKNQIVENAEISPSNTDVTVTLSQIADTKLVGIKVPIIGTLKKENTYVKSVSITPQTAEIRGKKYALNDVQFIQTNPVDISDLTESTTLAVQAIPPLDIEFTTPINVQVEIILDSLLNKTETNTSAITEPATKKPEPEKAQ